MPTPTTTPATAEAYPAPLLAADVGGTHVRVGLLRSDAPEAPSSVLDYRKYRCADFPGLSEILATFLRDAGQPRVRHGIVASAGYALDDGRVIASNLPWPLVIEQTRRSLDFQSLHLVNDFEAVAYAAPQMPAHEVLHLCGPQTATRRGPALIIGPGTGLGAALWIPTSEGDVILATEAGQATLTATTETELAVLRELRRQHAHVSIEHLISGPGLLTLYRTLAALREASATHQTPEAVAMAGLAHEDAVARETLLMFADLLGSILGDMALLYGVHEGIYLAGGFLPQLGPLILQSHFVERFLSKGNMRPALEQIPVKIVEHGQLGVMGAAIWWKRHLARDLED
ncbi:MAG: glucokinase [Pseudoxanthomonas sp.]